MGKMVCACCLGDCKEEESVRVLYLLLCPSCEKKLLETDVEDESYALYLALFKNGWLNVH